MTHDHHAPAGARYTRLRRTAAAGALVPLLALAACSSGDAGNGQGGSVTQTVPSTGGTGGSTGDPTSTASAPRPTQTVTGSKVVITDPDLGHAVHVRRVAQNVPWPNGSPVSSEAYDIVAVEIRWKAGMRYTATLFPWMLTLQTSKTAYATTTTEFGALLGPALVAVARNQERTGWVYFRVDKGSAAPITLTMHRPDYAVSTTNTKLPRKDFSAVIVD